MDAAMVLRTNTSGRAPWADPGWPACDERLVTAAEANAHRVGGPITKLLDVR